MGWRSQFAAFWRGLMGGQEPPPAAETSPAPAAPAPGSPGLPGPSQPEPVPADMGDEPALERYRRQIDEFDEDREPPLGRLVRQIVVIAAYLGPLVVAWVVGLELGDAFAGGSWSLDSYNLGMHVTALLAELLTGGLALASAHALKKTLADRAYLARCVGAATLFVVLSGGSCVALWWVVSRHGAYPLWVQISRVVLGPLIDLGAIVCLATLDFRSLARHLQTIHQKADAVHQLAEAEIRLREAEQAALNRQREAEQFLAARRLYEETLAEMSRLQMQGVLKVMERAVGVVEAEVSPARPPLPSQPSPKLSLLTPLSERREAREGKGEQGEETGRQVRG
ncbi:MAG: hypothetical protein IRZ31_17950 [Thermogemmatispora sp.]|uniref:hypothetical protein n=1 Tax=Thermogemmatispora sp. TaxID=1968838 RepID=UPI0026152869|nr:hypothetical protein [Thermogemmatispora sp.]MBX5458779.1 hypothetical protein [Thermogemmatispora sp.]